MELVVQDVGKFGVIKDLTPQRMPKEAWTDARNVEFNEMSVVRSKGYVQPSGTPPQAPRAVFALFDGIGSYLILPSISQVFALSGNTYNNITRASGGYTGTELEKWIGSFFQGSFIITQGVDIPQVWQAPYGTTPLIDLPNWPVNTRAKVIRPFKSFLIALGLTKGGSDKPYLLKWSHEADPGTLPISWDETDPTKDAGEFDLADTSDFIVDCITIRDTNIVFKENTTWGMSLAGTNFIFRSFPIYRQVGALATDCCVEINGGKYLLVGDNDIVSMDAANPPQSMVDARLRRWFYNNLDTRNYNKVSVHYNKPAKKIWIPFPSKGNDWCDLALVWDMGMDRWSIRDMPLTAGLVYGPFIPGAPTDTWDEDSLSWDSDTGEWGGSKPGFFVSSLFGVSVAAQKLYQFEQGTLADGAQFRSYVERQDVPLGPMDRDGRIQAEFSMRKLVQHIYPTVQAPVGTTFKVEFGGRDDLQSPVIWSSPRMFRVGIDLKVGAWINTRSLAVRFSTDADIEWSLDGYKIEYTMAGI